MKYRFAGAAILVVSLGACSNSPPSCGDSDATDLVKEIVTDEFEKLRKALMAKGGDRENLVFEVEVKEIRTVGKDQVTGSYECAAKLDVASNTLFLRRSQEITYTTEITEDSGELYVTVYGLNL